MDRHAKVEVFRGAEGRYYFRRVAGNGERTGTSQGYTRKETAVEYAIKRNLDVAHDRFFDLILDKVIESVWLERILGPRR